MQEEEERKLKITEKTYVYKKFFPIYELLNQPPSFQILQIALKGYGKVELVIFCETTFYKQHDMTI